MDGGVTEYWLGPLDSSERVRIAELIDGCGSPVARVSTESVIDRVDTILAVRRRKFVAATGPSSLVEAITDAGMGAAMKYLADQNVFCLEGGSPGDYISFIEGIYTAVTAAEHK